jgi:hypothetical protein
LLASAKGVVSGLVLGSADVCHDEKALAEPCSCLFVVPAALGDKKGWVNVGLGGLLMSTHASVLVDSVGPPSAEVCRTAASFP